MFICLRNWRMRRHTIHVLRTLSFNISSLNEIWVKHFNLIPFNEHWTQFPNSINFCCIFFFVSQAMKHPLCQCRKRIWMMIIRCQMKFLHPMKCHNFPSNKLKRNYKFNGIWMWSKWLLPYFHKLRHKQATHTANDCMIASTLFVSNLWLQLFVYTIVGIHNTYTHVGKADDRSDKQKADLRVYFSIFNNVMHFHSCRMYCLKST